MTAGEPETLAVLDGVQVFDPCITASNRAFLYGDGAFETLRVANGGLPLLLRHLKRLEKGASFLGIAFEQSLVSHSLEALTKKLSLNASGILKIIIYRGESDRASYPSVSGKAHCLMLYSSYQFTSWYQAPVSLSLAQGKLNCKPSHCGAKLLSRVDYLHAIKDDFVAKGEELLLRDDNDHIVDTPHHNIFWRQGNTLYTPELSSAGVAGVMRDYILSNAPRFMGNEIIQGAFVLSELLSADEILLTNALRGVVPVKALEGASFQSFLAAQSIAAFLDESLH